MEDPVIIQCATYVVDDEARLYLGVGRRTKSGELTGPFEAQFLRTRKRSKFAHMWNADDENTNSDITRLSLEDGTSFDEFKTNVIKYGELSNFPKLD